MPSIVSVVRRSRAAVKERAEQLSTALILCMNRDDSRGMPSEREARNGAERRWCGQALLGRRKRKR